MKDKLKSGGDALKGLIKTGGDVADKVLDKSTDVATAMMNHTTGLISKLSDDIGVMADRILNTEEQIGVMADRIVKTEELMAKLTASLAGKDLHLSSEKLPGKGTPEMTVLSTETSEASGEVGPRLIITGDPVSYLLYVSTSPLFREGLTVISKVSTEDEYDAAWKRSLAAIREPAKSSKTNERGTRVVSIAVKAVAEGNQPSALSNSVDVRVLDSSG